MRFEYDESVVQVLKKLKPLEANMLLDLFERKYDTSDVLTPEGRVFKTGPFRILFLENNEVVTVLRIVS